MQHAVMGLKSERKLFPPARIGRCQMLAPHVVVPTVVGAPGGVFDLLADEYVFRDDFAVLEFETIADARRGERAQIGLGRRIHVLEHYVPERVVPAAGLHRSHCRRAVEFDIFAGKSLAVQTAQSSRRTQAGEVKPPQPFERYCSLSILSISDLVSKRR